MRVAKLLAVVAIPALLIGASGPLLAGGGGGGGAGGGGGGGVGAAGAAGGAGVGAGAGAGHGGVGGVGHGGHGSSVSAASPGHAMQSAFPSPHSRGGHHGASVSKPALAWRASRRIKLQPRTRDASGVSESSNPRRPSRSVELRSGSIDCRDLKAPAMGRGFWLRES